jgi:choline dehydrogenase
LPAAIASGIVKQTVSVPVEGGRDGVENRRRNDVYDYVIVGAGSAGCVIANRLTEDPDVSVLLIEAGGPDTDALIHMPIGFGSLLKSEYDWDDLSELEPSLNDRRTPLGHGRVIGGSSSINAMIYLRGHRSGYDGWAVSGLDGWGYDDVLPYFRRSEDNDRLCDEFHAQGGPLGVSDSRAATPCVDTMIAAALAAGIPATEDFNGARQEGVGRTQSTTRNGRRCSAAVAFLHPIADRPNLEVRTWCHALRILFDGRRAVGIECERFGEVSEVRAEREVVLCAGTYATPQLLMLSGVGPAEDLQPMMIDVIEDLPVGRNLQDHCMAPLTFFTDGGTLEAAFTPENVELFESQQRGPLSSNVGEAVAYLHTRSGLDAPDMQIPLAPVMIHQDLLGAAFASAVSVVPTLVSIASRGQVTLRAARPHSKMRILNNYLEAPEDRATMIAGVRMALAIAEQPEFRALSTRPHHVPASESESDILDFMRRTSHTVWHPVGTCAMGGVVDNQLRVIGLESLRVIDASVMPVIPNANTNAPTIMIAEKGADLIKGRSRIEARPAALA